MLKSRNPAARFVASALALIVAGLLLGRSEGTAFGLPADYLSGFTFGAAAVLLAAAAAIAFLGAGHRRTR